MPAPSKLILAWANKNRPPKSVRKLRGESRSAAAARPGRRAVPPQGDAAACRPAAGSWRRSRRLLLRAQPRRRLRSFLRVRRSRRSSGSTGLRPGLPVGKNGRPGVLRKHRLRKVPTVEPASCTTRPSAKWARRDRVGGARKRRTKVDRAEEVAGLRPLRGLRAPWCATTSTPAHLHAGSVLRSVLRGRGIWSSEPLRAEARELAEHRGEPTQNPAMPAPPSARRPRPSRRKHGPSTSTSGSAARTGKVDDARCKLKSVYPTMKH